MVFITPLTQLESLVRGRQFYLEDIFLGILLLFIFSYNFHFLWLAYDCFALLLTIVFLNDLYTRKLKFIGGISFLLLIQFSYSLFVNGCHLISFLTFWDTLKHIPVIYVFLTLWSSMDVDRKTRFTALLWRFLLPIYLINFIWIGVESSWILQYYKMDNMAGSFGNGGTHSIAYFSLLLFTLSLWLEKNKIIVFFILFSSIYLNYLSENIGFYPLLFFILFLQRPFLILPTLVYITLMSFFNESFSHFILFDVIQRILTFLGINSIDTDTVLSGRNQLTHYASNLGGWLGQGLGAFSSIYGQSGFRLNELTNNELPISSLSHLTGEFGYLGMTTVLAMYLSIIYRKSNIFDAIILSTFFILSFVYGRLLMDERLIFMTLFIFIFLYNSYIIKSSLRYLKIENPHNP